MNNAKVDAGNTVLRLMAGTDDPVMWITQSGTVGTSGRRDTVQLTPIELRWIAHFCSKIADELSPLEEGVEECDYDEPIVVPGTTLEKVDRKRGREVHTVLGVKCLNGRWSYILSDYRTYEDDEILALFKMGPLMLGRKASELGEWLDK